MERANLKERRKDISDRITAEWYDWNATMLPEIDESYTNSFSGPSLRIISARRKQVAKQIIRCRLS
jgi:hypothetical protein